MQKLILFLIALIFLCNNQLIANQQDDKSFYSKTLLKEQDLNQYLKDLNQSEILQLERLCAYLFHQKINEYRLKNNRGWLYWDENLWLAARNHNIYLFNNFPIMSHNQYSKHLYFTGAEPNDRYAYVTSKRLNGYGENVYFNTFNKPKDSNLYGIASFYANTAFESWKTSDGHNKNMLHPNFNLHGTAFIFYNSNYATSVFSSHFDKNYNIAEIAITWDVNLAKTAMALFVIRDREIYSSTPEKVFIDASKKVLLSMMPKDISKMCSSIETAAKKNLDYMKANEIKTISQQKNMPKFYAATTKKRYLKAAENIRWFNLIFTKIHEKTAYLKFPIKDFFTPQKVITAIEVETSKNIPHPSLVHKWAYDIDFYKKSDYYVFVIDVVYILK